jgi:uncharacterized protein
MIVGTVEVDLNLPGVSSLKEKRRRLKSLLTRLQNKYNISIAEVAYNDDHRRAQLGAAVVSNQKVFTEQVIEKIIRSIDNEAEIVLVDYRVEIL